MIEIWSKPACPYCVKAKNLCEQQGYDYEYFQLDVDFTREELFEKFPTARTFPQITAHDEYVGGFTELQSWSEGYRTV